MAILCLYFLPEPPMVPQWMRVKLRPLRRQHFLERPDGTARRKLIDDFDGGCIEKILERRTGKKSQVGNPNKNWESDPQGGQFRPRDHLRPPAIRRTDCRDNASNRHRGGGIESHTGIPEARRDDLCRRICHILMEGLDGNVRYHEPHQWFAVGAERQH
jgi:hypothetical protein